MRCGGALQKICSEYGVIVDWMKARRGVWGLQGVGRRKREEGEEVVVVVAEYICNLLV